MGDREEPRADLRVWISTGTERVTVPKRKGVWHFSWPGQAPFPTALTREVSQP